MPESRQQQEDSRKCRIRYRYALHTKAVGASDRDRKRRRFVVDGREMTRPIYGLAFGGRVGLGILLQEIESRGFLGGKFGGFRNLLDRSGDRHFRQQLNAAVVFEARTSRDEPAHDDVFLQAAEVIHLASDGCFGEDAGGLLEAGGGDERVGRERRLGDAKEQRAARRGAATVFDDLVVLFAEAELVHLLLE